MALQSIGGTSNKSGISRLTTEFIYWEAKTEVNLSGFQAEMAFTSQDNVKPSNSEWTVAEIVEKPGDNTKQAVRLLIGPYSGNKDLTPESAEPVTYHVWVRVTAGVERIVRRAGTLMVR